MNMYTGIFRLTYQKTQDGAVLRRLEVIPCLVGKKGDYRPTVLEDQKEREAAWKILSPGKNIAKYTNPPASFLETGIVLFDENGKMLE